MDGLLSVSAQVSEILATPRGSDLYIRRFLQQAATKQRTHYSSSVTVSDDQELPETVRAVLHALRDLSLTSQSQVFHVPSTFYSWTLPTRALSMAAPSPQHLCKSVVFENKRFKPTMNSKYYCVIVQYVQTISTAKLTDFVRELDQNAVAKKHYNFRLADPEVALELTGFGNNGVCPVGMRTGVPVVLAESVTKLWPPVFWCGAGDVDYKLAVVTKSFVDATGCYVADISVPN